MGKRRIPFKPFRAVPEFLWHLRPPLSSGDLALLSYLIAQQIALKPDGPLRFSDDELYHGRLNKKGERADEGCGISAKDHKKLQRARETLIQRKGMTAVRGHRRGDARHWYYTLPWLDDVVATAENPATKTDAQ